MKKRTLMKTNFDCNHQFRKDAGYTIIEVLVSIAILSVGMLGLISSANSVSHYQRQSNQLTIATLAATNKLEEIKRLATNEPTGGAFGFNYLVTDTTGGYLNGYTAPDDWTRSSSDTVNGVGRSWTVQVFPIVNDANESFLNPLSVKMVEAVVTTTWTDELGQSKNVELAAVLHRRQFVGGN
jgi:prepilin-type N-terminal cleavage/methylation domain-containing protein